MTFSQYLLLFGFCVGFVFYVAFIIILTKRARKGRHPIRKDFKLSRRPGEKLMEEIEVLNEKLDEEFLMGAFAPIGIAALGILFASQLPLGNAQIPVLGLIFAAYVFSLIYRIRKMCAIFEERRRRKLGLMGERVVAEYLAPLALSGYFVFHDLPATGSTKDFNLDHVVVGPSGIFVIETKARRKLNENPQDRDHIVRYDGKALFWPQSPEFPDTKPVTQAANNAGWLRDWIAGRLNLEIPVTPILVVPGWFAERLGKSTVLFVTGGELENAIRGKETLEKDTIDLIQRQLASLCRNISTEA